MLEFMGRHDLPAENQRKRKQQIRNISCRLRRLNARDNHVRERAREDQERQDEQEHQRASLRHLVRLYGIRAQANGIVPAHEDEYGHERVPGDLNENI